MDNQNSNPAGLTQQSELQMSPLRWFFSQTINVFKANWTALLGLIFIPLLLIFALGIIGSVGVAAIDYSEGDSPGALISMAVFLLVAFYGGLLYMYSRVLVGVINKTIAYLNTGEKFKANDAWNDAKGGTGRVVTTLLRIAWPVFVANIVAVGAILLSFLQAIDSTAFTFVGWSVALIAFVYIFSLIYGYYVFTRYGLAVQYAAYEHLSPGEALTKSKKVSRGYSSFFSKLFFSVIGISFVVGILGGIEVIGFIVSIIFSMLSMAGFGVLYVLIAKLQTTQSPVQPNGDNS